VGGLGSSRWDAHTRRALVEECFGITVGILSGRRWERLDGRLSWGMPGDPDVTVDWSLVPLPPRCVSLAVEYPVGHASIKELIPVEIAATLPGGARRFFFRCPGCRRRVAQLHLPSTSSATGSLTRFRCRRCHRLGYRSQLDRRSPEDLLLYLDTLWGRQTTVTGRRRGSATP
jgi:hypothetical protein